MRRDFYVLITIAVRILTEAGAYAREGLVDLAAQEGKDQDNDDSNEYENEGVLYQALAFLLQLIELSAHWNDSPYVIDYDETKSASVAVLHRQQHIPIILPARRCSGNSPQVPHDACQSAI